LPLSMIYSSFSSDIVSPIGYKKRRERTPPMSV
jgi:hypothetical protein